MSDDLRESEAAAAAWFKAIEATKADEAQAGHFTADEYGRRLQEHYLRLVDDGEPVPTHDIGGES